MSKMKEIDSIAQGVADHCWEILYDSVAWQIADMPVNGDDYYNLRDYTVYQTVIKLLEQVDLVDVDNYKQNTIISGQYICNK